MHEIKKWLPEAGSKIWHWHPVWFLEGNPIVGYSKLKDSVRLMFWSGQSFEEAGLQNEWSFKAAEKRYTDISQINKEYLFFMDRKISNHSVGLQEYRETEMKIRTT